MSGGFVGGVLAKAVPAMFSRNILIFEDTYDAHVLNTSRSEERCRQADLA